MNWRNPETVLPEENQEVWVMLLPHKDRGSFLQSAQSIQIVCGHTSYSNDEKSVVVENWDELGHGSEMWYLKIPEDFTYDRARVMAWLPVSEMVKPDWVA